MQAVIGVLISSGAWATHDESDDSAFSVFRLALGCFGRVAPALQAFLAPTRHLHAWSVHTSCNCPNPYYACIQLAFPSDLSYKVVFYSLISNPR